jgi:hypothetical protein
MTELGVILAASSDFLVSYRREIGMDWNFTHIDMVLAPIIALRA